VVTWPVKLYITYVLLRFFNPKNMTFFELLHTFSRTLPIGSADSGHAARDEAAQLMADDQTTNLELSANFVNLKKSGHLRYGY